MSETVLMVPCATGSMIFFIVDSGKSVCSFDRFAIDERELGMLRGLDTLADAVKLTLGSSIRQRLSAPLGGMPRRSPAS